MANESGGGQGRSGTGKAGRGAPSGNRNAAKLPDGPDALLAKTRLNSWEVAVLQRHLQQQGLPDDPREVAAAYRQLGRAAIRQMAREQDRHEPEII